MKYALDTPFAVFRQLPRHALPVDDESDIKSLVGVGLVVEELDTFPDPLTYLGHYEVSMCLEKRNKRESLVKQGLHCVFLQLC